MKTTSVLKVILSSLFCASMVACGASSPDSADAPLAAASSPLSAEPEALLRPHSAAAADVAASEVSASRSRIEDRSVTPASCEVTLEYCDLPKGDHTYCECPGCSCATCETDCKDLWLQNCAGKLPSMVCN